MICTRPATPELYDGRRSVNSGERYNSVKYKSMHLLSEAHRQCWRALRHIPYVYSGHRLLLQRLAAEVGVQPTQSKRTRRTKHRRRRFPRYTLIRTGGGTVDTETRWNS